MAGQEMLEGKSLSAEEALEATRRRGEKLSEHCKAVGRDPGTIGRSLCAVPPPYTLETPFASRQDFEEFVERHRKIGITEFIFLYPVEDYYPAEEVQPGIFERLATEVIPALRTTAHA